VIGLQGDRVIEVVIGELSVNSKGFDFVDAEEMIKPLDGCMCRRERMRKVSLEGVSESLSGGSFWGLSKALILVWVRVWRVHVRLIGSERISTIVPGLCMRSAFARGCISA
jgi:hypothetical protein